MCFTLSCLLSFAAASHGAFPNHLVYTGRGIGADRQFVAMDVGLSAKKYSYDSAPLSLAYGFGFKKWDLALSASYTLSNAWQVSFIPKYHFFSGGWFDLGVKGAVGVAGSGKLVTPFVSAFVVGSSRWDAYEAALDVGFAPVLLKKRVSFSGGGAKSSTTGRTNKRKRGGRGGGRKFSSWPSAVKVGTSHTYHWSSDFSTTLSVHTNLKVRHFALNLQARHLF